MCGAAGRVLTRTRRCRRARRTVARTPTSALTLTVTAGLGPAAVTARYRDDAAGTTTNATAPSDPGAVVATVCQLPSSSPRSSVTDVAPAAARPWIRSGRPASTLTAGAYSSAPATSTWPRMNGWMVQRYGTAATTSKRCVNA
jgi:hypothetical protein